MQHHGVLDKPRLIEALTRASASLHAFAVKHYAPALCAASLLLMGLNFLSVIARKSITIDETNQIPTGYYDLVAGRFDIQSEHPPVPEMLAAVPLLVIQPDEPSLDELQNYNFTVRAVVASREFWQANAERFHLISFWARVPMILLTLMLGALVFAYTRRLFGARAALFAVVLFSLEPTMLAHGRVVKDAHTAFAYLLFFVALHFYATRQTLRRALLLGLASGLAPLFKFSMGIVLPVLLLAAIALVIVAPRRGQTRLKIALEVGACMLAALLVINAAYYFQHPPLSKPDALWLARNAPASAQRVVSLFGTSLKLLPTHFIFGFYATQGHNKAGHSAYLLGMYGRHGWWFYFPVAFALKTTIPFLALTVAAIPWALFRLLRRRESVFLWLLCPVGLYLAAAMMGSINIGIRHLLPVFPFLFILGGALLDQLLRVRPRFYRHVGPLICALLIGWSAVEMIRAYPHYIPYMNQLTRGEPGWHYLSDSNVEWGDDAPELAAYLRARGERRVRGAFLGGELILPFYGVEYLDLIGPGGGTLPATRYVAIGASFLNGSTVSEIGEGGVDTFAAYRERTPEAVFGNSIYLFREKE